MPRYILALAILILTVVVILGCTDRGTNITEVDLGNLNNLAGIDPDRGHVFQPALTLQLDNDQELLVGSAYLPAEVFPPESPVPMLILLAPESGDKFYYFRAGLEQQMKEMTASGEIDPMVVYCIANPLRYGGFWYGQSGPAGKYDDILGDPVVQFLNDFIPAIIDLPSKRGIGGIGEGAYGAFRAVIKHPGVYSSISVADGPLDFDGASGSGGLIPLFQQAMAEQLAVHIPRIDTTLDTVVDTGSVLIVDTLLDTLPYKLGSDWRISNPVNLAPLPLSLLFTGGALAFSPNDTVIHFTRQIFSGTNTVVVRVDSVDAIAYDTLPNGGDSAAFVYGLIQNTSDPSKDFDFHLPFDSTGALYQPIWDLWMRNNLEDIYTAQGGRPLDGVNIWIASNPDEQWNYYEMTQSWISFLKTNNYPVEEYEYSSFDDETATHDQYMFDLLRKMLIFHSDNFKN